MSLTGHALALTWRCVSLGCRHRDVQDDVAMTEAVCQHPAREGKPCSGAEAALGRCPIITAAMTQTVTGALQQFAEKAKAGWSRLLSKMRRPPAAGRPLPDFYHRLGVRPTATADEIEAAYRALTKIHHPDRGGDGRTMADINEAHDVLGDPAARAEYNKHARRRHP